MKADQQKRMEPCVLVRQSRFWWRSFLLIRQAAQFIVERAEGREVVQRVIDIGFSIVEREST